MLSLQLNELTQVWGGVVTQKRSSIYSEQQRKLARVDCHAVTASTRWDGLLGTAEQGSLEAFMDSHFLQYIGIFQMGSFKNCCVLSPFSTLTCIRNFQILNSILLLFSLLSFPKAWARKADFQAQDISSVSQWRIDSIPQHYSSYKLSWYLKITWEQMPINIPPRKTVLEIHTVHIWH